MRIKYKRKDLDRVFERIVLASTKDAQKGIIEGALRKMQLAARVQYNVNSTYSDSRLERLILKLSDQLLPEVNTYQPQSQKILFYDYFGISNRGLTQQYLDALFQKEGIEVVYVLESEPTEKTERIYGLLEAHSCRKYVLSSQTKEGKIKVLYDIISKEQPSTIFYHISPWSPVPLVGTAPFTKVRKVLINITDHAFGLGDGHFFDESFEFREYGCKVSLEKRDYQQKQLRLLPYYPWQETVTFQGFPIDTSGKVVLFSGAYLYKIEDPGNTFFHIVSRILNDNPDAVMLFAGGGDSTRLQSLIAKNNLSNRFVLLGNRTDISEVFKNIDIYIGTYPYIGGLMTQYAAINGKPILAYKDHDIEKIVCNKNQTRFVYDTIDELTAEAKRLISDIKYRNERSKVFLSLTNSQHDFRQKFWELVENRITPILKKEESIDYDEFCQKYIDLINISNNSRFERQIFKDCPTSIHWKMLLNIMLNLF